MCLKKTGIKKLRVRFLSEPIEKSPKKLFESETKHKKRTERLFVTSRVVYRLLVFQTANQKAKARSMLLLRDK